MVRLPVSLPEASPPDGVVFSSIFLSYGNLDEHFEVQLTVSQEGAVVITINGLENADPPALMAEHIVRVEQPGMVTTGISWLVLVVLVLVLKDEVFSPSVCRFSKPRLSSFPVHAGTGTRPLDTCLQLNGLDSGRKSGAHCAA